MFAVVLGLSFILLMVAFRSIVILGNRNWYFPLWLEWVPDISVEGHLDEEPITSQLDPVSV